MAGALAVETRGLTKDYGAGRGVFGLDLAIRPGEIFGYLGPNGAGKTTTLRLLLDLIRPSGGSARVLGLDSRRDGIAIRRQTGYVPGDLVLYERLTGRELLSYFAGLRHLPGIGSGEQLAAQLDLDLDRPIRELSKGNRQKVGLAQALMHAPRLLVLDEPTSGLDPIMQARVHTILREAARAGTAVLLSSHVLAEVERVADRVGLIRSGRLILAEGIDALKRHAVRRIEIRFAVPAPVGVFSELPGVRSARSQGERLELEVSGSLDAVVKAAAAFEVLELESREPGLEEIFLGLYRESGGDGGP